MKILFLILVHSLTSLAQESYEFPSEDRNPDTQDVLLKRPEKYLRNESMIYDFNTELGIKDQRHYTGQDKNRFSLAGHVSSDYEHLNDILGLEFAYMRRSERYHQAWYGFQFFRHKTYFDNITQNHTVGTNINSEAAYRRPNNEDNTVTGIGLGGGYRFKLLLDFFETEDTFESVDVFVNYLTMDETFIRRTYKGYGLTTNYGVHKRSSSNFFYGGKLSYNLATVTRDAIGNEPKDERTFSLGWLSIAFEIGFFY